MQALLALVMGENSKNSNLAKDAAQMVGSKPFFRFHPAWQQNAGPGLSCFSCPPPLLQVANLVLMKYGRTDEARASRALSPAIMSHPTLFPFPNEISRAFSCPNFPLDRQRHVRPEVDGAGRCDAAARSLLQTQRLLTLTAGFNPKEMVSCCAWCARCRLSANRLVLWRFSARRQVQPLPPPACLFAAASPSPSGDRGKSRVSEWASSHPLSEHRVSDIMNWISQQYPHDVPSESLSCRRLRAASHTLRAVQRTWAVVAACSPFASRDHRFPPLSQDATQSHY